jgi:hypothetical protein
VLPVPARAGARSRTIIPASPEGEFAPLALPTVVATALEDIAALGAEAPQSQQQQQQQQQQSTDLDSSPSLIIHSELLRSHLENPRSLAGLPTAAALITALPALAPQLTAEDVADVVPINFKTNPGSGVTSSRGDKPDAVWDGQFVFVAGPFDVVGYVRHALHALGVPEHRIAERIDPLS